MNKKKLFTFAIFAAVILTACSGQNSGGGASGDALTYTDPAYKFSFSYPSDWKVSTVNSLSDVVPVAHLKTLQVTKTNGPASSSYVAIILGSDFKKVVQDIEASDVEATGTQQSSLVVSSTQEVSRNNHAGFKGQFTDDLGETEYFYVFPVPNRNLMLYVQYRGVTNGNQVNEALLDSINFNS